MTFQKWVDNCGGVEAAAKILGVSKVIVYKWCAGSRRPSVENMANIIKQSKNKLTYTTIINSTIPPQI